jgi:uncharacterized protein YoxC
MSLMDKVKEGFDKAREEVSDLAETTMIKHDISKLNDRKNALLLEIGHKVYALHALGQNVNGVEAQCQEVQTIDGQIKGKSEEIARINAA